MRQMLTLLAIAAGGPILPAVAGTVSYYAPQLYATMPLYGAALAATPAQPQAQADPVRDDVRALREEIAELRKLLQQLLSEGGPQRAPDVPAALQSAATKCYACHGPETAKDKGGGFVQFTPEGSFRQFTSRDLRKLIQEVSEGTMPPKESGQALTKEEQTALLNVFKSLANPPREDKK